MLPSFDHATSRRIQKRQLTKHQKQPEAYIINNIYEELFEQNNTLSTNQKNKCRSNQFWNHYILPKLHEYQPDVVLLHIGLNNVNNQTKDKINTGKLTENYYQHWKRFY